jgi:hypothetical protein
VLTVKATVLLGQHMSTGRGAAPVEYVLMPHRPPLAQALLFSAMCFFVHAGDCIVRVHLLQVFQLFLLRLRSSKLNTGALTPVQHPHV